MQEDIVKVLRVGLLVLLVTVALFVFVYLYNGTDVDHLRVVFFDVGQGDAVFIESPTGVQVLIDGGAGGGVLRYLSGEMGFFDRTIDLLVATHPDKDHIGGLPDVLKRYEVRTIVRTENEGETETAKAFLEHIVEEDARVVLARRGTSFDLGEEVMLEVLFPDRDPTFLESNTASIVMQLTYKNTRFLFTGDAPKGIEDYLVILDGESLESDVLKIGHHGSRTSTSELFLQAVDPDYGVVSAGKDNRYGHPHAEVLARLKEYNVVTKNTAEDGSITFLSDGTDLYLEN